MNPTRLPLRIALLALVFHASSSFAGGINHFEAAAGPHNYLVTNHPAVLPHLTPSAWVLGSYAHDPLVFRDEQQRQVGDPIVEHQVNAELAVALGLFDRLELGVVVPGAFMQGAGFDGEGLQSVGLGDLRLLAKVLFTPWNEGFVASGRLQSNIIPVAQLLNSSIDGGKLLGEALPDVQPAISVGYSHPYFKVGLDVGAHLRFPREVNPKLITGSAVTYGAGAEVAFVPQFLYLTADVYGRAAPILFGSDRNRLPLEGALAIKSFLGPVLLMVGGGTGLIPDYGAPDFRVFAAIGYYPPPAPKEEVPEPVEEVPPPKDEDRDGDGILDKDDQCPDDPEDKDNFEDEDGCPEPDNDKDGIPDKDDGCPLEPEDVDNWEDKDGCPEPDNDKDGILDGKDECPNDPEVMNGFEDEDGCPDEAGKKKLVVVKRDKIEILDKVYFATDSDRILPKSYPLLDNVAEVIKQHTEIPAIFVEGHTDSDGKDAYNLDLSDRRAKSVMRYLLDRGGVDGSRLKAQGFGETKPIDTNSTAAGKANNRRVEFRIINADGSETTTEGGAAEVAPADAAESKPTQKAEPTPAPAPADDDEE
jgi:large repetitive protein